MDPNVKPGDKGTEEQVEQRVAEIVGKVLEEKLAPMLNSAVTNHVGRAMKALTKDLGLMGEDGKPRTLEDVVASKLPKPDETPAKKPEGTPAKDPAILLLEKQLAEVSGKQKLAEEAAAAAKLAQRQDRARASLLGAVQGKVLKGAEEDVVDLLFARGLVKPSETNEDLYEIHIEQQGTGGNRFNAQFDFQKGVSEVLKDKRYAHWVPSPTSRNQPPTNLRLGSLPPQLPPTNGKPRELSPEEIAERAGMWEDHLRTTAR